MRYLILVVLLSGCVPSTYAVNSKYYYDKYQNSYTLEDYHKEVDYYIKHTKWHYTQCNKKGNNHDKNTTN